MVAVKALTLVSSTTRSLRTILEPTERVMGATAARVVVAKRKIDLMATILVDLGNMKCRKGFGEEIWFLGSGVFSRA